MPDWASTERTEVRITLAGGTILEGHVFLQPCVAWRDGPETVLDLLNRNEPFLPFGPREGGILLLARAHVTQVEFQPHPDDADIERQSLARTIVLRLTLADGRELSGVVHSELPANHRRALDFLNAETGFFELDTATGPVCLNRSAVRSVSPLD